MRPEFASFHNSTVNICWIRQPEWMREWCKWDHVKMIKLLSCLSSIHAPVCVCYLWVAASGLPPTSGLGLSRLVCEIYVCVCEKCNKLHVDSICTWNNYKKALSCLTSYLGHICHDNKLCRIVTILHLPCAYIVERNNLSKNATFSRIAQYPHCVTIGWSHRTGSRHKCVNYHGAAANAHKYMHFVNFSCLID